jgi:hypothetical protein
MLKVKVKRGFIISKINWTVCHSEIPLSTNNEGRLGQQYTTKWLNIYSTSKYLLGFALPKIVWNPMQYPRYYR